MHAFAPQITIYFQCYHEHSVIERTTFCSVGQSCHEDLWWNGRIDLRISNLDTREGNIYISASAVLNRRNLPLVLFEYEVWRPSNLAKFGGEEKFSALPVGLIAPLSQSA